MWQAATVRRRTERLPPATDRAGCCGPREGALVLVGIGDSIIDGIGGESHLQSLVGRTAARLYETSGRAVRWHAHGFSGLTLSNVVGRLLPRVPAADLYLVSAGVNDAIEGTRPSAFAQDLRTLATGLRVRSPDSRIVFAGIPPFTSFPALPWPLSAYLESRGRTLQVIAQTVAAEMAFSCHAFGGPIDSRDFARDGFHPGPPGCDRWARALVRLFESRRT